MTKNWRTSLGGLLGGIGAAVSSIGALLGNAKVAAVGASFLGVGQLLSGLLGADSANLPKQ